MLLIGWINAFNFINGINRNAVFDALAVIVSFLLLPFHYSISPLLIKMGIACLVFLILDKVPKLL